jgi:hypothetical protein
MGALISAITPTIGQLGGDGATLLALALSSFPRAVLGHCDDVYADKADVVSEDCERVRVR